MKTKIITILIVFILFSCKKENMVNDSINNDSTNKENMIENFSEDFSNLTAGENKNTHIYDYDDEGHIIYQKDDFGTEAWFENGMLIHKKNSNGEQWFDNEGHRLHSIFANGNEEWYDENERIIHKKYSNGNEKWREYDGWNLIHEYGTRFGHEYDLTGNLSVDSYYRGNLYYYGNLVYSDDFHLENAFYEYDSKNPTEQRKNLITGEYSWYRTNAVTIPDTGKKISGWCVFDKKNRITSLAIQNDGWGEAYWWFEYDDKNRIIDYSYNGDYHVSLEYWSNNKIKRIKYDGVAGSSFYYGFLYDVEGNETFFFDSKDGGYYIKEYQDDKEVKSIKGNGSSLSHKFLSCDGKSFYFDDEDNLIAGYLGDYLYERNGYQEKKCEAFSIDENGRTHINEGYLLNCKTEDIVTTEYTSEENFIGVYGFYEGNYHYSEKLFSKRLEEDDEGSSWGDDYPY